MTPASSAHDNGLLSAAPLDTWVDIRPDEGGLRLHVRCWPGMGQPFVLLHGLASNARTWDGVAHWLAAAGHAVFAVNQRGHGLSDKPGQGYDFATIVDDLARLLDCLQLQQPVVVGQSWGGNVVVEFGAHHAGRAAGFVLVDGGFIDLQMQPGATWPQIAERLRPPELTGIPRSQMKSSIWAMHPEWSEDGIEATLGNFETLADGAVRPWLTLDRHMQILQAMWEQKPGRLYPALQRPTLIVVADDASNPEWMAMKRRQVEAAAAGLQYGTVAWFAGTAHDIHVHRPTQLAELMLTWSKQR